MSGAALADTLARLEGLASEEQRQGHARFALAVEGAFGVSMRDLRALRKEIGTDHDLALALWEDGRYEARLLAGMIADPAAMGRDTVEAWITGFDNWAVVDTLSFDLLDRLPFRWSLVDDHAADEGEFQKRTAFALIWSLTRHDRDAPDDRFRQALDLIEREATDPRTYVFKAVDMALRAVGKRNAILHADALATAGRLAGSDDRTASRIGRRAARELESPKVIERLKT